MNETYYKLWLYGPDSLRTVLNKVEKIKNWKIPE